MCFGGTITEPLAIQMVFTISCMKDATAIVWKDKNCDINHFSKDEVGKKVIAKRQN